MSNLPIPLTPPRNPSAPIPQVRRPPLAAFISGVGYPDYAFVGLDVLTRGDDAVRAAGWLNHAWQVAD